MSDVVIRVEGLGKKYVIGHQSSERYTALRDVITRSSRNLLRSAGEMLRGRPIFGGDELEEFWALKDVSFEVKRGEVIGVIGRNGAGKSTLLKVLSRITEPSAGRVEIRGRVASLLEVGTGFHPELTGRENIYLNGAILGMTRAEISRKFDEIVAFAEVERFLDTPVKRYSSGMYVRLAFSVAAHLEPEILIVDEVLAVGDAEFQSKCLGKMQDVAGHGRTVIFVSHNMATVRSFCKTGLVLRDGQVLEHAPVTVAVSKYMNTVHQVSRSRHGPRCHIDDVTAGERPTVAVKITDLDCEPGRYELRVIFYAESAGAVAMGSVGGFGSAGIQVSRDMNSLSFEVDLRGLANAQYTIQPELVARDRGDAVTQLNIIRLDFANPPSLGETQVLVPETGFGYLRLPLRTRPAPL